MGSLVSKESTLIQCQCGPRRNISYSLCVPEQTYAAPAFAVAVSSVNNDKHDRRRPTPGLTLLRGQTYFGFPGAAMPVGGVAGTSPGMRVRLTATDHGAAVVLAAGIMLGVAALALLTQLYQRWPMARHYMWDTSINSFAFVRGTRRRVESIED